MNWVSVEALDSEMAVLGISPDSRSPAPVYWAPGEALPEPDDPKSFWQVPPERLQAMVSCKYGSSLHFCSRAS
jgi:hypothetical protein